MTFTCDMEIRWNSLLGHEKQISQLKKMMEERRMPHAILFSGAEGIGKRRVAEVMAAALLCSGENAPCGHCESCRAMMLGSHPDIHLIEPEASGRAVPMIRIEQLRTMQTEIARLPLLSKCRVVIIDQADRMNEAAENSLLKTLEEPVGETYFILVTCAASSLLDTIRSRCIPMSFGLLHADIIRTALENRGVAHEQAGELALLSDGSLGHAIRLLEKSGLTLRDDALECLESLGTMSPEQIFVRGKAFDAMSKEQLLEWLGYQCTLLRDLLVLYQNGGSEGIYQRDVRERLLKLLSCFSESRIFGMLSLMRETQRRLQANVNLRLLMESMLLRWRKI